MERQVYALLTVDEDKAFEKIDDGPISYLEKEAGWLEQSGIFLKSAFIADDDEVEKWQAYLNYLCNWVFSHQGDEFAGQSPAPYNEWLGNKGSEPQRQDAAPDEDFSDLRCLRNCKDFALLAERLKLETLKYIEKILRTPLELIVPRTDDDYPDFDAEWSVKVSSKDYEMTGHELLVLKWYESFEDSDTLITFMQEFECENAG